MGVFIAQLHCLTQGEHMVPLSAALLLLTRLTTQQIFLFPLPACNTVIWYNS